MGNVIDSLRREIRNWGDIVFASQCPLCQRSAHQELCQDCLTQVKRCQWVDRQTGRQDAVPVFTWGHYKGALKRTIAALKYDKHRRLARPLGHWLAQAWMLDLKAHPQILKSLTVVPIPLHASKLQERGFNQAELLGRSFCNFTRLPLQPHGLIRNRATEAQFSLSPQAREQNLSSAFDLGTLARQRTRSTIVLLLDDIYTTGATARSAIHVLQQNQIQVYGIVTVARAGELSKKA
jgi:ComF family protein